MSEDLHKKAAALIAASRVEGISASDREWLDAHLGDCTRCAERAESVEKALAALRSHPVTLDAAVVEGARRRVRARAMELREQQSRRRGLWVACVLSWLFGAVSAWPLWMAFQWLGAHFNLPEPLWVVGLGIYWILPAAAGAAALAWRGSRNSQAEDAAANPSR